MIDAPLKFTLHKCGTFCSMISPAKSGLILVLFVLSGMPARGAFEVPPLRHPVTDLAGIVEPSHEQTLNRVLQKVWREAGVQLAVLTLPSIDGLTIEQASIQVADAWQLGTQKEDKGLLILVVTDIRRMRIEVGQGLEGAVPDAIAKRIIDETMTPLFKAGQSSNGILVGVYQVLARAAPDLDISNIMAQPRVEAQSVSVNAKRPMSWLEFLVFSIIMALLIFTRTGRTLLFFMLVSGFRGGGSGGSGGFGGGGYSGGGGGFSGGGASGGW